jgi:signal peptidase II
MRPWLISAATLAVDQLTKFAVTSRFLPGDSVPVLPPVLYLSYVQNTGAAFGLFKGQQLLFIVCSTLIIVWIVREFLVARSLDPVTRWGYALVLGGASGNLIDRLRLGHVIDFIDVRVWPVFNVGDSAITVGVTLLVWHALFAARKAS